MHTNPFDPPQQQVDMTAHERGGTRLNDILSALAAIAMLTIVGWPVGAFAGFGLLLAVPRGYLPSCGNDSLALCACAGAATGFAIGLFIARRMVVWRA
jgi:hypothetical protein